MKELKTLWWRLRGYVRVYSGGYFPDLPWDREDHEEKVERICREYSDHKVLRYNWYNYHCIKIYGRVRGR